jgi:nitrous oxidase accessory protein NosD
MPPIAPAVAALATIAVALGAVHAVGHSAAPIAVLSQDTAETRGLPRAFDVGIEPLATVRIEAGADSGARLGAALRAAEPGTHIVLAAGRHVGGAYAENLHGTAAAPIRVSGEPGAVLDAAGGGNVLHVSRCSYLVIESLELTGAKGNGINIDDGGTRDAPSHHVVLRDLSVHTIGSGGNSDGIKLSGLDDFFVLDCRITKIDAGDAIDQVGCHRGVLHGNRITETSGGGFQMKGGSSDTLVHGNWFEGVAGRAINAGGSTGLEFFRPNDAVFEAARLSIESNVFVRCGANHGCAIAFASCDAVRFVHNTVVDSRTWILRILQDQTAERFLPCQGGLVANNIFVFDRAAVRTPINVGGGTDPASFTFTSNLWFARDDASFTGQPRNDNLPADTHPIATADPKFAESDPPYQLTRKSPAARAARPLDDVETIGLDFVGTRRGKRASLGAFEHSQ